MIGEMKENQIQLLEEHGQYNAETISRKDFLDRLK